MIGRRDILDPRLLKNGKTKTLLKHLFFMGNFIESNFIIYELILISDDPINKEIDKYGLENLQKK